jgi:DNA-binding CsgD family transcriptional regulator
MGLAIVMVFVLTMERVMKTARPIELSSKQRIELERMVRSQTLEVRAVRRAQIVLLAADGMGNREIAAALGIGRVQVGRWRERFVQGGVAAIEDDLPRSGRKPRVEALLHICGNPSGG